MKLKYSLLALSALAFFACEPLEDAYDTIDKTDPQAVVKTMEDYVLTDADYTAISKAALADVEKDNKEQEAKAKAVASSDALNDFATGGEYLPEIVAKLVPSWGKGSSVNVTYNYQNAIPAVVTKYSSVISTYVSNAEYESVWGDGSPIRFFTPTYSPENELPGILAAKYADAKEGDLALIEYKYDSEEPVFVQGVTAIEESFEAHAIADDSPHNAVAITGWKQIHVKGAVDWFAREYSNNKYANISAFRAETEVDSWLVMPAFMVVDDMYATFDMKLGNYNGEVFDFMLSETHNGGDAIITTQWVSIKDKVVLPPAPEDSYSPNWVNVGKADISEYKDKTIYLALRYVGDDLVADNKVTTTVQVDNILVTATALGETNEKPYNALYQLDASTWKPYNNEDNEIIVVTPADYDAMGNPGPGQRGNFSSSIKPEDYLPTLLKGKYPYALNDKTIVVLYKYYNGDATVLIADEYIVVDEIWVSNKNISVVSKEKYVNNGEAWIFDPTIVKPLLEEDYHVLVEWVVDNKNAYADTEYTPVNTEYWFGASSHYTNFRIDLIKRRENDPDGVIPTDEKEAKEYLLKMVAEGIQHLLKAEYSAVSSKDKDGLDQYIRIECKVRETTDWKYGFTFKVLGDNKYEWDGEPAIEIW